MSQAYYMVPVQGVTDHPDRVGGLPNHLPPAFPVCRGCGEQMAFLFQLYCTPERLCLDGVLCLHCYQCPHVDEGCTTLPEIVAVPCGAPLNCHKVGVRQSNVVPHGIQWALEMDPDRWPDKESDRRALSPHVYTSKVGGVYPPLLAHKDPGAVIIAQIGEYPYEFNFADRDLHIYLGSDGKIKAYLF